MHSVLLTPIFFSIFQGIFLTHVQRMTECRQPSGHSRINHGNHGRINHSTSSSSSSSRGNGGGRTSGRISSSSSSSSSSSGGLGFAQNLRSHTSSPTLRGSISEVVVAYSLARRGSCSHSSTSSSSSGSSANSAAASSFTLTLRTVLICIGLFSVFLTI